MPASVPALAESEEFRFFISRDPVSLHPLKSLMGSSSHVLNNLFRGYYRVDGENELQSELVTCRFKTATEVRCKLKENLRYSGGGRIVADDFMRTLQLVVSSEAQPAVAADLVQVKNAMQILAHTTDVSTLGVRKLSDQEFAIDLTAPDRDFLYRMAAISFTPLPADYKDEIKLAQDYATGPYRLKKWDRGRAVSLVANPHYHGGTPSVMNVRALIVSDETTALKLFQTGKLDFLQRVPTEFYKEIKDLPGFAHNALLRMDYLGFGAALAEQPKLLQAMALALDYEEFKRAFYALGRPGCFGISAALMGKPVCYDFDLKKAKALVAQLDPQVLAPSRPYKLLVSDQGGDHVLRTGQWFQGQWKKNLGLKVEIEVVELGVLNARLKTSPPDIVRRGVPVDRPTCLAALEPFLPDSPDNFLHLQRPKVAQIAAQLRSQNLGIEVRRRLCREAMKDILSAGRIIPLGEIHFITLSNKTFSGIELNALHQLNLARLRKLKPDQSPSEK